MLKSWCYVNLNPLVGFEVDFGIFADRNNLCDCKVSIIIFRSTELKVTVTEKKHVC